MLFFDKGIKMTNINYEISLKTEIMNEAYTGLIADFIDYFNLTCKKSPPSIGGEMNCGFFCGFDALRKTIAL